MDVSLPGWLLWAETGRVTLAKDHSPEQACQLPDVSVVGSSAL